jgi:hypothetical protein
MIYEDGVSSFETEIKFSAVIYYFDSNFERGTFVMAYVLNLRCEGTGGVRLVVPENVVGHLSDEDQHALKLCHVTAQSFSNDFKVAALTVAGISNAAYFHFDVCSARIKSIPLNHLAVQGREDIVSFTLTHQSELPSDVKGSSSKTKAGDRIIFDNIVDSPHFEGEYNDSNQKYTAEVHLSIRVVVRDAVFVQGYQGGGLAFVSPRSGRRPCGRAAVLTRCRRLRGPAAVLTRCRTAVRPCGRHGAAVLTRCRTAVRQCGRAAVRPSCRAAGRLRGRAAVLPCGCTARRPCCRAAMRPCGRAALRTC